MKKDNDLKNTFIKAIENHKKNNLHEAKKLYLDVLLIDPKNLDSYNNLGIIYHQLGQIKKSIEYYKKAIEINPNFAEAHHNLKLIFFSLGNLEDSYNHHINFLKIRSKDTVTRANIKNIIPKLAKKLQSQNHVPTFFDNMTVSHLISNTTSSVDYCEIFENGIKSKDNRFISLEERKNNISNSFSNNQLFSGLPFLASQGIHSLIKWKGNPMFKTTFDLTIYSMILEEIKPDFIIELGSGLGASAVWMADICVSLGLNTHIYSIDIVKPDLEHEKVTFLDQDLNDLDKLSKNKFLNNIKGKKLIIEDAHVNIKNLLNFFNKYIEKDDYLIIEDSSGKQDLINNFINLNKSKYKVDQFYLDFFGTNITSCINSIFKCF